MLLAGAFIYIYFISIGEIISRALYIFKASPHPYFPWIVIINQLVLVSLTHFRLRYAFIFYVLLASIINRQLLAIISSLRCFH